MNVLITGGTGFIGRALIDKLLKGGHNVKILSRYLSKVDSSLNDKVDVLESDIEDLASLENLKPKLQSIDIIFHLAASLDYYGDRKSLFDTNVLGTINLLNWAEKNGIRKIVFTSSIEAMGMVKSEDIPADENYICKPVSTYGVSKLEAEKQVNSFAKEKRISAVILRLGNVYGPGSQTFILSIIDSIFEKDKLQKYFDVIKDRYLHPVYIEDVVDGIVDAAEESNINGTFILADNEYITAGALFNLITELLNVKLQIKKRSFKDNMYLKFRKRIYQFGRRADFLTYLMAGEGQAIHRAYSIEKARRELNYFPKVGLKEGISKTLSWAKKEGRFRRYNIEDFTR